MKTDIIKITSPDNPDWEGVWEKEDVEQEMRELDNPPSDEHAWLYWIAEHVFDSRDLEPDFESAVCECDAIRTITAVLDGRFLKIEKI